MPTETVYGLAADATNAEAVARIYEAKGRPSFNPLIVHVPDLAAAERIGDFSDEALELARAHWPGPLTLVVPLREGSGHRLARHRRAFRPSAFASPTIPRCRRCSEPLAGPLAAPSANASGSISPTRAEHVLKASAGGLR